MLVDGSEVVYVIEWSKKLDERGYGRMFRQK